MTMPKLMGILLSIGFVVGFPLLMIRLIVGFYQSNDLRGGTFTSGLVGGMLEVDRITRPSIQIVEEVKEHRLVDDFIDGD